MLIHQITQRHRSCTSNVYRKSACTGVATENSNVNFSVDASALKEKSTLKHFDTVVQEVSFFDSNEYSGLIRFQQEFLSGLNLFTATNHSSIC